MQNLWVSIIGWIVSITISITGWVLSARSAKKKTRIDTEQFKKRVGLLEQQVNVTRQQVELLEKAASIPNWRISQTKTKSVKYVIVNDNMFDAFDVHIEFNEDEVIIIGDLPKGGSRNFTFMQASIMGGVKTDLTISWLDSPDSRIRNRIPYAMPARL